MIYRDTLDYLLHNTTSKEFDAILTSLLYTDWEGLIHCPTKILADKIGSNERYMKKIVKKFTQYAPKKVFTQVETDKGTRYKLNLGKPAYLGFNEKTDQYCKKYELFYKEAFQNLPINAKRLILMACFEMSVNKSETVRFDFDDIVPTTKKRGLSTFNRQRLVQAIEAINNSEVSKWITVELAQNPYDLFKSKEEILFFFKEGMLSEFKSNFTERSLLRSKVYNAGFLGQLTDEVCIELERVAKHIFTSFQKLLKSINREKGLVEGVTEALEGESRIIYNRALEKLARGLNSNHDLLTEPKRVSAYFSAIVYEVMFDESMKHKHQAESIRKLKDEPHIRKEEYADAEERNYSAFEMYHQAVKERLERTERVATVFIEWCEKWTIARENSVENDLKTIVYSENEEEVKAIKEKRGWEDVKKSATEYIASLKEEVLKNFDDVYSVVKQFGNKRVVNENRIAFIDEIKEKFISHFAIKNDRIEELCKEIAA